MVITDLNYLEVANNEVVGGFSRDIKFSSKVSFKGLVASKVVLTPFSSSALAEADAAAAPYYIDGASFTQTSTVALAGLAGGATSGAFVGSVSTSTSAAATLDFPRRY